MSVNKFIGIGNLTKSPELRYTAQGTAVCSFSIACNERYKDKNGQQQEKAEFINMVAWGNLADIISKYFSKGKEIYVEGKLQTRSYDDKDGNKRYVTEVVVKEFSFTGSGNNDSQPRQQDRQSDRQSGGGVNQEPAFNPDDEIPFRMPQFYREGF